MTVREGLPIKETCTQHSTRIEVGTLKEVEKRAMPQAQGLA